MHVYVLKKKCSNIMKGVMYVHERPGGGGGTSICMHIEYVQRERPSFSVPEHITFTNFPKIRSGASPFYIFGRFGRSEAYHFHKFPKKSVPEDHHFTF